MKINQVSIIASLVLAGTGLAHAAVNPTTGIPNGGGAYFYAWNANQYCDKSLTANGNCPEKWTDMIKNVNAKMPAGSKGQVRYIYIDDLQFNMKALAGKTALPSTTPITIGGCNSTDAMITYCSSTAMTYVDSTKKAIDGNAASAALVQDLGSDYYIMPTFNYAPNLLLSALPKTAGNVSYPAVTPAILKNLAYSLSCLVTANPTTTSSRTNTFNCSKVLVDGMQADPNITGLGFDIESDNLSGPTPSGAAATDSPNAGTFYSALAGYIANPNKIIMFSRGPHGLNNNPGLVQALSPLLQSSSAARFIFAPQIYDLCDGMGSPTTGWACPIATPIGVTATGGKDGNKDTYAPYFYSQGVPNTPMQGGGIPGDPAKNPTKWSDQSADLPIYDMSMAKLFLSEIGNAFGTVGAGLKLTNDYQIPVQLIISGGGSSQIWTHVNLYGVMGSKENPYENGTYPGSQYKNNLSEIYGNSQVCQAENADGTLGRTITSCRTYKNPYASSVADYAGTFFNATRYWLTRGALGNTGDYFVGLGIYPFTPYGYFDKECPAKVAKNGECAGFYPEVPDGLVNGQKPKFSFWDAYVSQFGIQPMATGAPSTIPLQAHILFQLPPNYYSPAENGEATVSFDTFMSDNSSVSDNISYRVQLLNALGNPVASANCPSTSCDLKQIPAGQYVLRIQALNPSGAVVGSVEAAAAKSVAPPPSGPVKVVGPVGSSSNGFANITWSYTGSESGFEGFTLVFNGPNGFSLKESAPLANCLSNSCKYSLPIGLLPAVGDYSVSLYPSPNSQGAHGVNTPQFSVAAALPVKIEDVTASQSAAGGSVKLSWSFAGGSPGVNQFQVLIYSKSDSGFNYKQDADLMNSCIGSTCSTTIPMAAFSAGSGSYFGTIYAQTTPAGASSAGKSSIPAFSVSGN